MTPLSDKIYNNLASLGDVIKWQTQSGAGYWDYAPRQAVITAIEQELNRMSISRPQHMYYGLLGSASRDEGRSWAAKQAAIHRANRIPLAEAWISES